MIPQEAIQRYRISPQQRRAWHLAQNSGAACRCQCLLELEVPVELVALEMMVRRVVDSHEIFSTAFHVSEMLKLPLQEMKKGHPLYSVKEVSVEALLRESGLSKETACDRQRQAIINRLFDVRYWSSFDLQNGPLMELSLIRLAEDRSLLLIQLSSLWADAATLQIFTGLLVTGLNPVEVSDNSGGQSIQYPDFCEWQNDLLE